MEVEAPVNSTLETRPESPANNMVAIDAPVRKAASTDSPAYRLRQAEEDLGRLQDQLMDVLEENQQLRAELEVWKASARMPAQQNKAS